MVVYGRITEKKIKGRAKKVGMQSNNEDFGKDRDCVNQEYIKIYE